MKLPDLSELLATATPFALPLRRPFRGLVVREGVLLRGPSGWGEFAPFDDYSDVASGRWLAAAIEAAHGTWPAPMRVGVPVNAILPSLPVAEVADWTAQARDEYGVRTVKVKVAESPMAEDAARLRVVREVLGTAGRIRIDGNGRWSLEQALRHLPELAAAAGGLEYAEQPLSDLADLARLRSRVDVRIAIDEGLRSAPDPADRRLHERIRAAGDLLVLKAGPLGGVRAALDLAAQVGLPAVVSGALDSSVGLAAGLALAAALPDLRFDCGLGTGALLAADLVTTPVVPHGGRLPTGRIAPDTVAVESAAAGLSPERSQWWLARLAAAYEVLAA